MRRYTRGLLYPVVPKAGLRRRSIARMLSPRPSYETWHNTERCASMPHDQAGTAVLNSGFPQRPKRTGGNSTFILPIICFSSQKKCFATLCGVTLFSDGNSLDDRQPRDREAIIAHACARGKALRP